MHCILCIVAMYKFRIISAQVLYTALTDLKGPTIFISFRRISVIVNVANKEKLFNGLKHSFCYRQISVTGGAVIAGFNCMYVFSVFPRVALYLALRPSLSKKIFMRLSSGYGYGKAIPSVTVDRDIHSESGHRVTRPSPGQ